MRCAWHPKYRGYPWIYSISSWRGRNLVVSDGMCRSCARHWRDEFRAGRPFASVTPPLVPAWMPRVGVALALTAAVVLAARPLDPATAGRAVSPSHAATMVAVGSGSASPVTAMDDCSPRTEVHREIRVRAAAATRADVRAGVPPAAAVRSDAKPVPIASSCRTQSVSWRGTVAVPGPDCVRIVAARLTTGLPQLVAIAQAP